MTYTLKFDPWTQEDQTSLVRFVLLYQAFLGTADNPNRSRNIEETRQAILILDAFSSVSDLVNNGQPNETRILKPEGGELKIEEAGIGLLKRSVEAWVGTVPFAMAKTAMDVKTFVEDAPSN